jgi:hypothetical protein
MQIHTKVPQNKLLLQEINCYKKNTEGGGGSRMLSFRENCRIIYMALAKSTHPNAIHYNNKLVIMIETKKTLMQVESLKAIFI